MGKTIVGVAKTRGEVLLHFTGHQATAPERAIGFNPTQPGETTLFDSLRADGTVLEASPGLFYADERKLADHRAGVAKAVAGIGVAAGVLVATAVAARLTGRARA